MNRQHAIDALVDITIKELLTDGEQTFLHEFIRNGFYGYSRMSDQRLQQELVYRGLKDCVAEEIAYDEDEFEYDTEPALAPRFNNESV
jgi:hypothetical protein